MGKISDLPSLLSKLGEGEGAIIILYGFLWCVRKADRVKKE